MLALLALLCSSPALAGPGFDGVGDGRRPPALGAASADPLEEVMRRESEILGVVRDQDPEHHARLLRLKERDPTSYVIALLRTAKRIQRSRQDPETAERHRRIGEQAERLRQLVRDWHEAEGGEQRALRKEIEEVAAQIMALKQEERRARLEELRQKIGELEAEIEQREGDKNRIVEEFVDQMLAKPVDL